MSATSWLETAAICTMMVPVGEVAGCRLPVAGCWPLVGGLSPTIMPSAAVAAFFDVEGVEGGPEAASV